MHTIATTIAWRYSRSVFWGNWDSRLTRRYFLLWKRVGFWWFLYPTPRNRKYSYQLSLISTMNNSPESAEHSKQRNYQPLTGWWKLSFVGIFYLYYLVGYPTDVERSMRCCRMWPALVPLVPLIVWKRRCPNRKARDWWAMKKGTLVV